MGLARGWARREVLLAGMAGAASADGGKGDAMGASELSWQGAAGRRPDRYVVVEVESVEAAGGGLFGILRSPSIAGALPDAKVLTARAAGAPSAVRLRAPGAELPALAGGDLAVLGTLGGSVCLCVLKPPPEVTREQAAEWAAGQPCGR